MNKLQLYKSASDAAFASLAIKDPAQLDIFAAQEYQNQKLDPLDYALWRSFFGSIRTTFLNYSNQPAPSQAKAQAKPAQQSAPIPAPKTE